MATRLILRGIEPAMLLILFKILFEINLIQTNYLVLIHVPDQIICVHHTSDSYVLDLRPKTNRFQLSIILLFWPNIVSNLTCKTILVVNRFNPSIQDFNCYNFRNSLFSHSGLLSTRLGNVSQFSLGGSALSYLVYLLFAYYRTATVV